MDHAHQSLALWEYYGRGCTDIAYAFGVLLVIDDSVDGSAVRRQLDQIIELIRLSSAAALSGLLQAWAYVRSGETDAARAALSGVEPLVDAIAQPGVLGPLARRVAAMVDAGADEPLLTERETTILAALAAGASRREAAEQMHLSVNTVKTNARQAYRALGVRTLEDAIRRCADMGISLAESDRHVV